MGGPYLELCAENKIYSQMYRVLCITFGEAHATEWADEEDFLFCLRRLKKRGLVAECDGESKEEALWLLLSKSVVAPATNSLLERLGVFADDLALGKGLKSALRAFKKARGLPMRSEWFYSRLQVVAIFLIFWQN